MPTYVDTSGFLRLVNRRGDVSLVEAAMKDSPVSSELGELECWASIHKRWHDGEISRGDRDELLRRTEHMALANTLLLRLDTTVLDEARSVTARYPLRTLDAIHLATAVLLVRRLQPAGHPLRFCTADARQAAAATGLFGASAVDLVPPWR